MTDEEQIKHLEIKYEGCKQWMKDVWVPKLSEMRKIRRKLAELRKQYDQQRN